MKKIKLLNGEQFKDLKFKNDKGLKQYAVSNKGRVASYKDGLLVDGKILNASVVTGYIALNVRRENIKAPLYIHREIAKLFLPKPTPKQKYVIHLNHKKMDNSANNLKWATTDEMSAHQQKSPSVRAYREVQANTTEGRKLNLSQVKNIKKILADKNTKTTIKSIALAYKVSQMTIYRIKSGENWKNVKV